MKKLNLILKINKLHFKTHYLQTYNFLHLNNLTQYQTNLKYILNNKKTTTSPHLTFYKKYYYKHIKQNKNTLTTFKHTHKLNFKHHNLKHQINNLKQNTSNH